MVLVLASRPLRTKKFLMGLAVGVPIISYAWYVGLVWCVRFFLRCARGVLNNVYRLE